MTTVVLFLTVSCTKIEQRISFDGEHYEMAFTYVFDSQWLAEKFKADMEEIKALLFATVGEAPAEIEWEVIDDGNRLGFSFKMSENMPGMKEEDWMQIGPQKENGVLTVPFFYPGVILAMRAEADDISASDLLELQEMHADRSVMIYVDKTIIQKAASAELLGTGETEPVTLSVSDTGESFCIAVPMNLLLNFQPYDRIVVRE